MRTKGINIRTEISNTKNTPTIKIIKDTKTKFFEIGLKSVSLWGDWTDWEEKIQITNTDYARGDPTTTKK